MISSNITRIITQGRQLFPLQNAGNKWAINNASKIVFRPNLSKEEKCDLEIHLNKKMSAYEQDKSRSWSNEEANIWLYQQLEKAGAEPALAVISTPVLTHDLGVLAGNNLFSLSETAQEAIDFGKVNDLILNPVRVIGSTTNSTEINERINEINNLSSYILNSTIHLSCEKVKNTTLTHLVSFFYPPRNVNKLELFTSYLTDPLTINFDITPNSLNLNFSTIASQNGFPYHIVYRLFSISPENPENSKFENNISKHLNIFGFFQYNPIIKLLPIPYDTFNNPPKFDKLSVEEITKMNLAMSIEYFSKIANLLKLGNT